MNLAFCGHFNCIKKRKMKFEASNLQKTLRKCEVNPASDEYIVVICDLIYCSTIMYIYI